MVFVVYVSLMPFRLRHIPLPLAWLEFRAAMAAPLSGRVSRSDVLANCLLFVPIGFAAMGALLARRRRSFIAGALAAAAVLSACAAVSGAAEFLQVFAADRVSSWRDVLAQSAGAAVGIAAWIIAGPALTRWLRAAATTDDRLARVLAGYGAAWLFVNLAPFDITVDLGDLAARVRGGGIILDPLAGDVTSARFAWDALIDVIAAAPLGVLGLVHGVARGGRRSTFGALGIGSVLVVLVEAAQIFIRSHVADTSDVFFGLIGVAVGARLGALALSRRRGPLAASSSPVSGWASVALAGWCTVIVAYHWLPYDFAIDADSIRDKLARMSLIPFSGYQGSNLDAVNDVLQKMSLAIPFGAIAAFVWRPEWVNRGTLVALWLAAAAVVFAVAELGQFFLATRVPDPTDVLLGIAGSYVGLRLGCWLIAPRLR